MQQYFADELEDIKSRYIESSFGNIYSITAGIIGQPLILVVHGSGPKNSSEQYRFLLHQYLVRISYVEKFYLVAIDCPGYGKSIGSKEAVKTFPLKLFQQILKGLNYTKYYAMFGHSQGGSAIFHAVYQDSSITQNLLMDRPVCGNIQRFRKFMIPTLLIYDIEDDGHPIWQGKQLFKQLNYSQFHQYRSSQDPYWVPDHLWNKILLFFNKKYRQNLRSSSGMKRRVNRSEEVRQHSSTKKKEYKPASKSKRLTVSLSKKQSVEKKQLEQNLPEVSEREKSQISFVFQQQNPQIKPTERQKYQQISQNIGKDQLKIQKRSNDEVINNKKHQYQYLKEQKMNEIKQNQQKNLDCSICFGYFYHPVQLNCKHIFCSKCIAQCFLVDQRCPLCRTIISRRNQNHALHCECIQHMSAVQINKKQKEQKLFHEMLNSIIYVEIGNNSQELLTKKSSFTKTKRKYNWQVYAKEPKNFKFEEVSFNINMGNRQSKPIKIRQTPFFFQSRSTFSFTCEIIIKPKNRDYPQFTAIYRINVQPGNHNKKIALKKKCFMK